MFDAKRLFFYTCAEVMDRRRQHLENARMERSITPKTGGPSCAISTGSLFI